MFWGLQFGGRRNLQQHSLSNLICRTEYIWNIRIQFSVLLGGGGGSVGFLGRLDVCLIVVGLYVH